MISKIFTVTFPQKIITFNKSDFGWESNPEPRSIRGEFDPTSTELIFKFG